MTIDPDRRIRAALEEIIALTKDDQTGTAAILLSQLERDNHDLLVAELPSQEGTRGLHVISSLRTHERLAREYLEAGDDKGALISLEQALTIVTKYGKTEG